MSCRVNTETGFIHVDYLGDNNFILVVSDKDNYIKMNLTQEQYSSLSLAVRHELLLSFEIAEQLELPLED